MNGLEGMETMFAVAPPQTGRQVAAGTVEAERGAGRGRPGWRGGSFLAMAGFLAAGAVYMVCVSALFAVSAQFPSARTTPPWYILPMVPLCMLASPAAALLCGLSAIPKTPGRRYRLLVHGLRLAVAAVMAAVFIGFWVYIQQHTGNAPAFFGRVAVQLARSIRAAFGLG